MSLVNGSSNGYGSSRAAKYELPSHFIGGNRLDLAAPSKVKDFVAKNDGHSVISSVGRLRIRVNASVFADYPRFSLPITVLPPSRRFDPYENGPTRPSATNVPFSSRLWLPPKIYGQMRTIFAWPINMSRYLVLQIIIIMPMSSLLWMLLSEWTFMPFGPGGKFPSTSDGVTLTTAGVTPPKTQGCRNPSLPLPRRFSSLGLHRPPCALSAIRSRQLLLHSMPASRVYHGQEPESIPSGLMIMALLPSTMISTRKDARSPQRKAFRRRRLSASRL